MAAMARAMAAAGWLASLARLWPTPRKTNKEKDVFGVLAAVSRLMALGLTEQVAGVVAGD
jgi:hypothetical protein